MKLTILAAVMLFLTACAGKDDYTPSSGTTGEKIFKTVCVECHEPKEHGKYFELDKAGATPDAIAGIVNKGNFLMPSFPNIVDGELKSLSEYVLSNSKVE